MYDLMLECARSRHTVSIDIWAADRNTATKVELSVATTDANGGVELVLRSLSPRRREPLAIFDKVVSRTADDVGVCSFCVSLFSFGWQEAEHGLRQLRFPFDGPQPRIVPRVCDQCEHMITRSCAVFRAGASH
jgi:hypothetical protein